MRPGSRKAMVGLWSSSTGVPPRSRSSHSEPARYWAPGTVFSPWGTGGADAHPSSSAASPAPSQVSSFMRTSATPHPISGSPGPRARPRAPCVGRDPGRECRVRPRRKRRHVTGWHLLATMPYLHAFPSFTGRSNSDRRGLDAWQLGAAARHAPGTRKAPLGDSEKDLHEPRHELLEREHGEPERQERNGGSDRQPGDVLDPERHDVHLPDDGVALPEIGERLEVGRAQKLFLALPTLEPLRLE